MTDLDRPALDRELKKGAAELLLLSVLEARPRHGYELGKLIESLSGGRLVFHGCVRDDPPLAAVTRL